MEFSNVLVLIGDYVKQATQLQPCRLCKQTFRSFEIKIIVFSRIVLNVSGLYY